MRVIIFATLVASAAALAAPRAAQRPGEQPARPGLVHIDVVVVNARGEPVRGLAVGDFDLHDEGVRQALDAAVPATVEGGAPPGRLLALFLDEYHVGAGATRVKAALQRFVDEELRPDDLVAVMKPLDPVKDIRFTHDRGTIRAAIEAFEGRKGDYEPRTPFEQSLMARAPAALEASRAQVVVSGLQALATQLGRLREGRKAIVLVSEGIVPGTLSARGRQAGGLQSVVYAADRFNVAIHPVDANRTGPASERDPEDATLEMLAEGTGGTVIAGATDPFPGVRSAARELDTSYLLSYTPTHPGDGKFHSVEVGVKRKDAVVRNRSGYWAALPFDTMMTDGPTAGRRAGTATGGIDDPNGGRVIAPAPALFRTRTPREFAAVAADANAIPVAARQFSRTERLLIRMPVSGAGGPVPTVTAKLLNRRGQTMRELVLMAGPLSGGMAQFDLSLAGLAPGDYSVEVTTATASGETKEAIGFRVIG